ncbi:hypothetical protein WCX18_07770 [Sulfurimonas sp. HSL1-2]|uniref:hypothetical protein n=1 Tax=Thiomicrolovo zhangzhouensis TaxID=3131933 RepID=UPI0031F86CB4
MTMIPTSRKPLQRLSAAEASAAARCENSFCTENAQRQTGLGGGIHTAVTNYIRKRLRVPDSFEPLCSCTEGEGNNVRVVTVFTAQNYRGECCTVQLAVEIDPSGSILSVKQI